MGKVSIEELTKNMPEIELEAIKQNVLKAPCFRCKKPSSVIHAVSLPLNKELFVNGKTYIFPLCDSCSNDNDLVEKIETGLKALVIVSRYSENTVN